MGADDRRSRRLSAARGRRAAGLLLAAALVLSTGACTALDNFFAAVPFFTFMREAPSFDPYEAPRAAPPNSVPFAAPGGRAVPHFANTVAGLDSLAAYIGAMPAASDEQLAKGADLFRIYCAVCHGPEGRGDGTILGPGKFPFAPNLHLPITVQRSDGYLYGVIRQGRGLMPAYGDRLTHDERWWVVAYTRQLQGGGSAPAAGAAADTTATGAAADTAGAAQEGE